MATLNELDDFGRGPFTSSTGVVRDIYRIGDGPAVIVIHEIPGITPSVATFARSIAQRAMTAVVPDLFGTAGRDVSLGYAISSMARARSFPICASSPLSNTR